MRARRVLRPLLVVAAMAVGVGVLAPPAGAQVGVVFARISGADRYETAAKVATTIYPVGQPVFIATGRGFADALAAGPAAAVTPAPILLTEPDVLPKATKDALVHLQPPAVVVVGGTSAVSDAVLQEIRTVVPAPDEVRRIGGADRFETAILLSEGFTGTKLYVASGENFPDALSGGAASGADAVPLLLTLKDDVPANVMAKITALAPQEIVLLGGTAAVSQAVQDELDAAVPSVVRRAGADRYATAAAISAATFQVPAGHDVGPAVFLANGRGFADALAAGPPAGTTEVPILLTEKDCIPQVTMDEINRLAAAIPNGEQDLGVFVVGGQDAVSASVVTDRKICA